ncbi:hypothetical protein [Flagellimonas lutaonensis]|nr:MULTISPECIES: hypothetical protein [Allomuricauda]
MQAIYIILLIISVLSFAMAIYLMGPYLKNERRRWNKKETEKIEV